MASMKMRYNIAIFYQISVSLRNNKPRQIVIDIKVIDSIEENFTGNVDLE